MFLARRIVVLSAAITEQAYSSVCSLTNFGSSCSRKHTEDQFVAMAVSVIAACESLQWCGGNPKSLGRDFRNYSVQTDRLGKIRLNKKRKCLFGVNCLPSVSLVYFCLWKVRSHPAVSPA